MSNRNGAAVWIHTRIVEGDIHDPEAAQHLRGKRFVDLDDVHVSQTFAG